MALTPSLHMFILLTSYHVLRFKFNNFQVIIILYFWRLPGFSDIKVKCFNLDLWGWFLILMVFGFHEHFKTVRRRDLRVRSRERRGNERCIVFEVVWDRRGDLVVVLLGVCLAKLVQSLMGGLGRFVFQDLGYPEFALCFCGHWGKESRMLRPRICWLWLRLDRGVLGRGNGLCLSKFNIGVNFHTWLVLILLLSFF